MKKILFLATLLSFTSISFAEEISDAKIDTILVISKKIDKQTEIWEPLKDKSFGVEINPIFLLLTGELDGMFISGGVQLFNIDRHAEISFPFVIASSDYSSYFNIDAHYRRFLGQAQRGFYLSGFARYMRFTVEEQDIFSSSKDTFTSNQVGLGFGLGSRWYSDLGLFWGFSINFGRYLNSAPSSSTGIDYASTSTFIFDVELLKIGYAF